jgi:hypothetical protein
MENQFLVGFGLVFLFASLSASSIFLDTMQKTSYQIRNSPSSNDPEQDRKLLRQMLDQNVFSKLKIALNTALASAFVVMILLVRYLHRRGQRKPTAAAAPKTTTEKLLKWWLIFEIGPTFLLCVTLLFVLCFTTIGSALLFNTKNLESKYTACAAASNVKTCLSQDKDIVDFENMLMANFIITMLFGVAFGAPFFPQ